jgi:chromo domain-containing protein 1
LLTPTGTWEPEPGLETAANVLETWRKKKASMRPAALERWKKKNEDAFEKARKKYEHRKALREEKRAKKRSRLRERNRRLVVDDSEDDMPLIQRKRTKNPPPALGQHDDGLFVKESAVVRRAPLDQSTDDDDDGTDLAGESNDEAWPKNIMGGQVHNKPGLGSSILRPKVPADKASRPEPHGQGRDQPRNPSRTLTTPSLPKDPQDAGPQQKARRGSESPVQKSPVAPAREVDASRRKPSVSILAPHHAAKPAKPATQTVIKKPAGFIAPTSRKNGTASKLTNPIRMTNQPMEASRKPWDTKDKMYNTLKFRGIAEKRARAEGTPDLDALQFVGARPPDQPKPKTADPADNPYGRREAGNRRVQETDNDDCTRRESRVETSPIREWEADKVPQMCPYWRLTSNCKFGATNCIFLHRDTDEAGRPIPIGREDRVLPPKFRPIPLTCLFWLENEKGCRKTAAQCVYAHHNTGWKPESIESSTAVQIDSNILPVSETLTTKKVRQPPQSKVNQPLQMNASQPPQRKANQSKKINPFDMTCWFWSKGHCSRSDEECRFKHYDTGTIAVPPDNAICQYFLLGKCRYSRENCRNYHPVQGNGLGHSSTSHEGACLFL